MSRIAKKIASKQFLGCREDVVPIRFDVFRSRAVYSPNHLWIRVEGVITGGYANNWAWREILVSNAAAKVIEQMLYIPYFR